MPRRTWFLFFVAVLCVGFCDRANAGTLIAQETVVATGVLDGTTFVNQEVTVTGTIDPSTFEVDNPPDGFSSIGLTGGVTVSVGGVTDTLNGHSQNPTTGSLFNGPFALNSTALSETGNTFTGADIGIENVILILSTNTTADYATALEGTLGPLSGHAGISSGYQFDTTSGGVFEMDTAPSSSTVTIFETPVPEPGSLALFCLGAVGLALTVHSKRRH